jgi:hypothetical protein
MSIEQENVIDFVAIDRASGDLHLTITDHLPWDHNEGNHLVLLQNKLNAYLRFIESGEAFEKMPAAKGRSIVIKLVGKFSLSEQASRFFELARCRIEEAGFRLQFTLKRPN